MKYDSKRVLVLLKMIKDGWYVKDGILYDSENNKRKCFLDSRKYLSFTKWYGDFKSNIGIHNFVAYQKFGNKIFDNDGKTVHIRHLDGNQLNNLDDNIGIGSPSENMMDKSKETRLRTAISASYKNRRFTDEEVELIKNDRRLGFTYKQLCEKYNTSKSTLSFLFNNSHYGRE